MKAQKFIDELSRRLRDVKKKQWDDEFLISALNASLGALSTVMPTVFTVNRDIALVAGAEQTIDDDLHKIVTLLHNVATDGTPRRAITLADMSVFDAAYPHWRQDSPRTYIRHWMHDQYDESIFYVWPPAAPKEPVDDVQVVVGTLIPDKPSEPEPVPKSADPTPDDLVVTLNPNLPYTLGADGLTASNGQSSYNTISASNEGRFSSGKVCWDVIVNTRGSSCSIGIAQLDANFNTRTGTKYLGDSSALNGYGLYPSGNLYYQGSSVASVFPFNTGDTITVMVDMNAGTLSYSKNGAAPVVAITNIAFGRWAPAICLYSGASLTCVFDADELSYVPIGHTAVGVLGTYDYDASETPLAVAPTVQQLIDYQALLDAYDAAVIDYLAQLEQWQIQVVAAGIALVPDAPVDIGSIGTGADIATDGLVKSVISSDGHLTVEDVEKFRHGTKALDTDPHYVHDIVLPAIPVALSGNISINRLGYSIWTSGGSFGPLRDESYIPITWSDPRVVEGAILRVSHTYSAVCNGFNIYDPGVTAEQRSTYESDYAQWLELGFIQRLEIALYNQAQGSTVIQADSNESTHVVRGTFTKTPYIDTTPAPIESDYDDTDEYNAAMVAFNARDVLTINSTIPVNRTHYQALQEFSMYYAYSIDDDLTANSGRAQRHWLAFFQLLNKREDANLVIGAAREVTE